MKIGLKITLLLLLGFILSANAQVPVWENENLRSETIIASDTVQLSTNVILPEKLQITFENGELLPKQLYTVDYSSGRLILDSSLKGESLTVSYYIHPDLQHESFFSKDTALIIKPIEENIFYTFDNRKRETSKPFDGLNSRGSLVRGIRFGNNQSASVQSSLDLQLTGNLTKDIGINAVISDNNVPIQADGYTQQLQEFDKIYVELFNKNSKIRGGHIDLVQENDFFGNFSQKVTGVQISTELTHSNDSKTRIQGTGSVTRGEFTTKKIDGQNGNQGPYRLTGNNDELYVIIVSGSERVYLDGILLTRGEDRDYVINYNTGELTFTSNRLITDNSRIRVEYLYANKAYSQFMIYGGVEHESERFSIAGHYYANSDSKNNPLNENLSDEDKQILSEAGNNTDMMYNTTAVPTEYDPERILYRKALWGNIEIFEYSNNPEEQLYSVGFTHVGKNMGNYIQSDVAVNGKIYAFVPPVNGIPQGEYEPVRRLIAPTKHELYTLNSAYKLKGGGLIGVDLGMSNRDLNLFSSKDDKDNFGFAGRIYANKDFKWNNFKIQPQLEASFIQNKFKPIQRLRSIEFDRDFNLENEISSTDQSYLRLGAAMRHRDSLRLDYNLHYLQNKEQYKGIKNDLNLSYVTSKTNLEGDFSLLNAKNENLFLPGGETDKTEFLRYSILGKRKIYKTVWAGAQYLGETNKTEDHLNFTQGDYLSEKSFRWTEIRGMAGIGDTAKVHVQFTYYNRKDDSVRLGSMQRMSRSTGFVLESKLINKKGHMLELNGHFRTVNYIYDDIRKEDYLTGNLKWFKSFFNNGMILNMHYELGSGTEPKREFEYVKVTDGTGIYKWTDYNGDGIPQLDEFEVAEYQDEANYIRVYTNTVEYVKTNKNSFNFSVRLKPKELLNTDNKFWDRWMLQASILTVNSLLKEEKTLEWNPFVNRENMLTKTRNIKGILNFNRGSGYKWSAAYTFSKQENQNYIFTGTESRDSRGHLLNLRYNLTGNFFLLGDIENSDVRSFSDMFVSRRFELDNWRFSPALSYQVESKFSASLKYSYRKKDNRVGIEKLKQSDLTAEIQWNDGSKSSLLANVSYVKNDFTGNPQSVVGNQMMEGLKAGNNFVWQLMFQRQLNSFLSVNLNYDGRKTEDNKTIHSGNIQLQARF